MYVCSIYIINLVNFDDDYMLYLSAAKIGYTISFGVNHCCLDSKSNQKM